MSSWASIAAVTRALRVMLQASMNAAPGPITGAGVTAMPPDRARIGHNESQLNIFLYLTVPNAAFVNQALPPSHRMRPTEQPPLGLDLRYLLTAYGPDDADDQEELAHQVLGLGMAVLHDHPAFASSLLEQLNADQPASDLHQQVERVRITQLPLNVEEVSKLWTSFQSGLRTSVAYEVSVVLIESERIQLPALPVVTRGVADRGVYVLAGPGPGLSAVTPDRRVPGLPAGRLGDRLVVEGVNLSTRNPIRFQHARLGTEIVVHPSASHPRGVVVELPAADDAAAVAWVPGPFWVAALDVRGAVDPVTGLPRETPSNSVPFALAALIERSPAQLLPPNLDLVVRCRPALDPTQAVSLVVADRILPPTAAPADPNPGQSERGFDLTGMAPGEQVIRLRVDGIDSLPVPQPDDPSAGLDLSAGFDPDQVVTI